LLVRKEKEYFNFINSIDSEYTKRQYSYNLARFLNYIKIDLSKFLKLPQTKITDLITEYLVETQVSKSTKNNILYTLKHACVQNDVLLNWDKIKKFTKSQKTGNEIAGRDRPYTHQEIQQILNFSDQRIKTAFLILSSTGIRIGALSKLKLSDLERIDDLYKVVLYSGDKDQYISFVTPECTKEIDAYLEYRKRRGEHITRDSYVIVKKFKPLSGQDKPHIGKPLSTDSLRALLDDTIINSGLREVDHNHIHKRKEVPLLHGLRKFTTKQLVDSNVKAEIREILLGHNIGLTGVYYRPTEQDMLNEYMKAIPLLTISDQERLKFKLEERITIERTQLETLRADFDQFKKEVMKKRK
jgi:integrase